MTVPVLELRFSTVFELETVKEIRPPREAEDLC